MKMCFDEMTTKKKCYNTKKNYINLLRGPLKVIVQCEC